MTILRTGEVELLKAAEEREKAAAVDAKESLASQAKDFVADHPVAAVGAAAGVTVVVALASRSVRPGRVITTPLRMAITSLLGASL